MPDQFKSEGIKLPIHDQIADLQRKIQLLEGGRSAYYQSTQSTIKKNKDSILQLRQENKRLHRKLANTIAGDEQVIKDAFHSRGMEKAAFRNKSGKEALGILDQKMCDKMKKLNALKHETETRRRHLEELQLRYSRMQTERQDAQLAARQREEEAKNFRALENRLEKARLKCKESEHIMKGYLKLKSFLQEESLTFQPQLDGLEAEILRQRQELRELQVMNSDAHLSKDAAKAELQQQEERVYRERRERERILANYKKQAEERRAHAERVERRAQRMAMHPDELSSEAQRSAIGVGEEDGAVSTFEEAFIRIKEATGVTDTEEVVERFISQGDTQKHLESLKVENEKALRQLTEERDRLQAQFEDMKYSGEAKLSSAQKRLEECKDRLRGEQERRDAAKERLDWLTRTLHAVRAGTEHLRDKLQHIKLSQTAVAPPPPGSEEYVLELLTQSEQKLALLLEELKGKDMEAVTKEMEDEDFHASIEGKLPHYNMRIKLPEAQKQDPYEEEESGDDESDIITRAVLKRQSQMIIDSKTKRKTRTKKKKGKQ